MHGTFILMVMLVKRRNTSFWIFGAIVLCCLTSYGSAQAQVVPDATLNSSVAPAPLELGGNNILTIQGGTSAGNNLFHSFEQFSLPTGTGAFFNNAPDISNIFTRVTGGEISNIDGFIRANGTANLFLLNPNGIVFGPNASLDLGGSFLATSADSIVFEDGTSFSATNTEGQPLLTVGVTVGLQFVTAPGDIRNESQFISIEPPPGFKGPPIAPPQQSEPVPSGAIPPGAIPTGREEAEMPLPGVPGFPPNGLRVQRGRTLALVGGDVFFPGGALTAEQGRIELGAVGDNSLVNLALTPAGFALDYSGVENFGDIQLSQLALVDVSGSGGGFVRVQGARVALNQGAQIIASTLADLDGGGIAIRASESLELISGGIRGPSGLLTQTLGAGAGGSIDISTQRLAIQDGAQISAQVTPTGSGVGGSITVSADDSIELSGRAPNGFPNGLGATTLGSGSAGDIAIKTGQLLVSDGATVISATGVEPVPLSESSDAGAVPSVVQPLQNTGGSGNVKIDANQLVVRNGAQVTASTFGNGDGGNIEISARESVEVNNAGIFSQAEPGASGNGGNLTVETPRLSIQNGGQISTGTLGSGNGGDLTIQALGGSVEVIGALETVEGSRPSALLSATMGNGNAGNLTIKTGQVIIREGQISADTASAGLGGNLTVNATSVEVSGQFTGASEPAVLSVSATGAGDGGNLAINTNRLTILEGARVSARTSGSGQGGDIVVNSSESVEVIGTLAVSGEPSILSASTLGTGNAGSLTIETGRLTIRDGAEVSSSSLSEGDGGDITGTAQEVEVTGGNSLLTAQSRGNGDAGNLIIETEHLTVSDGGTVSASGRGEGAAGNLTISATGEIRLENGRLEAETETNPGQGSQGANIEITTSQLLLRNGSDITAEARDAANGGNIEIRTETFFAGDDSDISANAIEGNGGNIQINTSTDIRSPDSEATASSVLGINGVVEINRPEIDPLSGLVELEEEPVDPESLIARGCNADEQSSRFVNTGLGGVPQSPGDAQGSDAFWEDFRPVDSGGESSTPSSLAPIAEDKITSPIVEARGWRFNEKGQIVLTGGQAGRLSYGSARVAVGCDGLVSYSGKPKEQEFRATSGEPKQIAVSQFQVLGSTVFEEEEFAAVLEPFVNRPLSFEELLKARQAVTELYAKSGYITSGVYIPPQTVADGVLAMQAQENGLEGIQVSSVDVDADRQLENYVKSRLERATSSGPVSTEKIVEALRLLQLEGDLIQTISAELVAGSGPRQSVLDVEVVGKQPIGAQFSLDNRRSPSVGSLRGAANLSHANLLGLGDRLDLSYSRTDGSNTLEFDYAVPINSSNTTLGFRFSNADSDIVEPPFDRLDIDANSRNYELTLRHPVVQRATNNFTREFALGLTASRRESETSLLGERFPLSAGANNNGETRISALRFFQEWTQQQDRQVFALRSQFSLGLGAFDATINNDQPDSRFFAWRGQGQWARRLGRSGLLLLRGDLQLATTSLVPFEQFGVGGFDSVRGYRQDVRLTDNGAFASLEARFPIPGLSGTDSQLQIIPFLDAGTGWNNDREDPEDNSLVSAGLGLRYTFNDLIDARLDFGIPLIDIDSRDRTWQENGIYFSIKVNPF